MCFLLVYVLLVFSSLWDGSWRCTGFSFIQHPRPRPVQLLCLLWLHVLALSVSYAFVRLRPRSRLSLDALTLNEHSWGLGGCASRKRGQWLLWQRWQARPLPGPFRSAVVLGGWAGVELGRGAWPCVLAASAPASPPG